VLGDRWAKSSHSNPSGNCVEAAFRKSSHSGSSTNCVEVAAAGTVLVRDSKDPGGPVLTLTAAQWRSFIERYR
jgi:hypothetical protein